MDGNKLSKLFDPWINENNDDLVGYNHQRFYRFHKTIVDYRFSTWGHWLRNPDLGDQNSNIAKGFNLPFPSFPFRSVPFLFLSFPIHFFNFL